MKISGVCTSENNISCDSMASTKRSRPMSRPKAGKFGPPKISDNLSYRPLPQITKLSMFLSGDLILNSNTVLE